MAICRPAAAWSIFRLTWRHLKAAASTGTVSIELEYSPEPDKIVDWVTEAYRETDRLMQSLGIRNEGEQGNGTRGC